MANIADLTTDNTSGSVVACFALIHLELPFITMNLIQLKAT